MKTILAITILIVTASCSLETIGLRHKMSQLIQEHQSKLQEKPMAGGWIKQPIEDFEKENNSIVQSTLSAVEEKFKPSEEGYEFSKVLQVNTQVVAGINYKILVEYTKEDLSRIFEVVQYVVPWNPSANKISKVEEMTPSNA